MLRILPTATRLALLGLLGTLSAQADDNIDYTVRNGDRLWTLSERYLGSPQHIDELVQLNQLQRPNHLRPGSVLQFPRRLLHPEAAPVVVSDINGETQLIRAGNAPRRLQTGEALSSGDVVETGSDSGLTLQFFEGSKIRLRASSRLEILRSESHAKGRLSHIRTRLMQGAGEILVPPRSDPNRRFELLSPAATTSVRGTRFRASVDSSGRLREEVTRGETRVANRFGASAVSAGLGISVAPGKPPGKPSPLLPAPDLSALPEQLAARRANLSWPALPGALAYRLQLSTDASFAQLLRDEQLPGPNAELRARHDQRLQLRVAAVDAAGLLGRYASHSIRLSPPPAIPELHATQHSTAYGESVTLSWRAAADASSYVVQLTDQRGFDAALLRRRVSDTHTRLDAGLPPGSYRWRVIAHASSASAPSTTGNLQIIAPLPPRPETHALQDSLVLRWHGLPGAARHELQLGTDPGFETRLSSADAGAGEHLIATLPLPADGRYFVRLRAVYSNQLPGPWGPSAEVLHTSTHWGWPLLWGTLSLLAI